jgi:hypothetical protein
MTFGIGFSESVIVVVTATRSGDTIAFTNHGGMDMDRVSEIKCWIGGTGPGNQNFPLDARGRGDCDADRSGDDAGRCRRDVN